MASGFERLEWSLKQLSDLLKTIRNLAIIRQDKNGHSNIQCTVNMFQNNIQVWSRVRGKFDPNIQSGPLSCPEITLLTKWHNKEEILTYQ